jgi:hypothetical protein
VSAASSRALAVCVISALFLSAPTVGRAAPGRDPRLTRVHTFALALGTSAQRVENLDRLAAYDLVVVDGENAPLALVDGLRARGVIVLGYLSVGTIEPGRGWFAAAKPYRLEKWTDWNEWFADTSSAGYRELILANVAPAILTRHFDGLFLDNVDMIGDHAAQRAGMEQLVHALGALVHRRGGLLFTQNGEDVIIPMLDALDGWNREDVTGTYDFRAKRYVRQTRAAIRHAQAALRRVAGSGLLVTATDYTANTDRAAAKRATRNACAAGALSFVSDIGLERIARTPPRCATSAPP